MPHAMTEGFTVEETGTEAVHPKPALGARVGKRQQEAASDCACPAGRAQQSAPAAKHSQQG